MTPHQLKSVRKELNLTQSELAYALGLSKHGGRTIRRWESGEWPIPKAIELAIETLKRSSTA